MAAPKPPQRADVLLVSSNFPPVTGGAATVYESICKYAQGKVVMLAASHDYTTGRAIPNCSEYDRQAPFRVYRRPLLRPLLASLAPGSKLRDIGLMLSVFVSVAAICMRHSIKTVCLGDLAYGGWLAVPLRRLLRRKVVIYVHGEEVTTRSSGGFFEENRGRFLAEADGVIAVSQFTADALTRMMDVPAAKVSLIRNGVDLAKFSGAASQTPERTRSTDEKLIVSVGRLVPRKGFDRLIEAMPAVLAACPTASLLIAGDGPQRAELEALVTTHGLQAKVTFLGRIDDADLNRLYEQADLFALPNRTMPDGDTEGFGLVFLEANAFGTPVVSGSVGGTIDAVTNGVNGLTVDGDSPAAIAEAVTSILSDANLADRLTAGARRVAQENDWPNRVKDFLVLCENLAHPSRRTGPVGA